MQHPLRPLLALLAIATASPAALAQRVDALHIGTWVVKPGEVTSVQPALGCHGEPSVHIAFDESGRRQLARITLHRVGKSLPIRLGDEILIKPTIRSPIEGGQVSIAGGIDDTLADSEALASRLQQALDLPALPVRRCEHEPPRR